MEAHKDPGTLHIVSLGGACGAAVERACRAVYTCLGLRCVVLSPDAPPGFALDAVRNQHDALQILSWLESRFPGPGEMALAIVDVDLFIPVLTFVYGEARLGGRSAVVSTFRLNEGIHGEPCDQDLFLSRVEKESIHEVGHMLGLTHCLDRNCVMVASNSLAQTDVKSPRLCPGCHAQLASMGV